MITIVPFLGKVDHYILNPLLEVLISIGMLYFIYSVIKLINADGDNKSEARSALMWSIVGLFIMASVYGIINVIVSTFSISPDSTTYITSKLNQ
jgi:uncharacterized membrane protein